MQAHGRVAPPDQNPQPSRAETGMPSSPSKTPARVRADDAGTPSIVVKVVQHRLRADLTEAYDRVAHFTLDPLASRSIHETLLLRDWPAMFLKIIYKADNCGLTVMLLQAGRDLLTLNTTGPADSHMTLRLSPTTALTLSIVRPRQ